MISKLLYLQPKKIEKTICCDFNLNIFLIKRFGSVNARSPFLYSFWKKRLIEFCYIYWQCTYYRLIITLSWLMLVLIWSVVQVFKWITYHFWLFKGYHRTALCKYVVDYYAESAEKPRRLYSKGRLVWEQGRDKK